MDRCPKYHPCSAAAGPMSSQAHPLFLLCFLLLVWAPALSLEAAVTAAAALTLAAIAVPVASQEHQGPKDIGGSSAQLCQSLSIDISWPVPPNVTSNPQCPILASRHTSVMCLTPPCS